MSMEIKILGEVESYDNLLSSIPQIINRIETICKNSDLVYSHMVIEGREVYDDPETYLQENIADLNRVEIVLKTIQEMMGEMMESAVDYLDRANAEINNLAEEFYNGPTEETWLHFQQLLDGMSWLLETTNLLEKTYRELSGRSTDFQEKLDELKEALEGKDLILVGDILKDELVPFLEKLNLDLSMILQEKDDTHDFN